MEEEQEELTRIDSIYIKPEENKKMDVLVKHEMQEETRKSISRLTTVLTLIWLTLILITVLAIIGGYIVVTNIDFLDNFAKNTIDYYQSFQ